MFLARFLLKSTTISEGKFPGLLIPCRTSSNIFFIFIFPHPRNQTPNSELYEGQEIDLPHLSDRYEASAKHRLLLQGTGAWLRGMADDSIRRAWLSLGVGENSPFARWRKKFVKWQERWLACLTFLSMRNNKRTRGRKRGREIKFQLRMSAAKLAQVQYPFRQRALCLFFRLLHAPWRISPSLPLNQCAKDKNADTLPQWKDFYSIHSNDGERINAL